jgi:hypothetical protein
MGLADTHKAKEGLAKPKVTQDNKHIDRPTQTCDLGSIARQQVQHLFIIKIFGQFMSRLRSQNHQQADKVA